MSPASPPPRGHRDPEGRRSAILRAAAELIVENGAAGISHRTIARRAGVSLGSTTQYFASLDELRAGALQLLADDIDEQLAEIETALHEATTEDTDSDTNANGTVADTIVDLFVGPLYEFLHDRRAVAADLALISTGALDPHMRPLAQRWSDRLAAVLTPHFGSACASAITVYLDGATVHAGLHDTPLGRAELATALRALLALRDPEGRP